MAGVDRQHQPVEKPAPLARRTDEQPVHVRGQPDKAQVIGEGARRADRRAVDAVEPLARLVAVARFEADAELMDRAFVLDLDRDRESAAAADPRAGGEFGAAQAAAGREQRQGLEQIGLAGAVLAAEDDERAFQRQVEARIGAEVAEHQPARHGAPARQGRFGRIRHAAPMCHVRGGRERGVAACRPATAVVIPAATLIFERLAIAWRRSKS